MTSNRAADRAWLWLSSGTAALALTGVLAWAAFTRPGWAVEIREGQPWWRPGPDNAWVALVFVLLWGLTVWGLGRDRPGIGTTPVLLVTLAGLTLILGGASYAPCAGGASWLSPLLWVLNLFVGEVEGANLGPASVVCSGQVPLAFQIARLSGWGTVFAGAGAALWSVSRQRVDRWWVRGARDIDVVVGLDLGGLALVRALVAERAVAPRVPDWYTLTRQDRSQLVSRGRQGVVVIHANRDEPALGEARSLGARVLIGDPADPRTLRLALLAEGDRGVRVRRLFAVAASQRLNEDVVAAAQEVLRAAQPSDPVEWLASQWVPRLVARFDDPRQAHDWRLSQVDTAGCFTDAISSDELIARELVNRLAEAECRHLIVSGDTPLTVAILDEVGLQRAFRGELVRAAGDRPAPTRTLEIDVTVAGEHAPRTVDEWTQHRSPGACYPDVLAVSADRRDPEDVATNVVGAELKTAIVLTGSAAPETMSQATRLSRTHPGVLVFYPAPVTDGVEPLRPTDRWSRFPVRYGPTLLQRGGTPEDSWTVLARQQHECFRAGDTRPPDGRAARRPWGEPGEPPGQRLPDFFREDTLRQQRLVLHLVRRSGWHWIPVTVGGQEENLPAEKVAWIAEREHERWCLLRERQGWTLAPPDGAVSEALLERSRRNRYLLDWSTGQPRAQETPQRLAAEEAGRLAADLRDRDTRSVQDILARLRTWGIAPGRPRADEGAPYRRCGEVTAHRLDNSRTWITSTGAVLRAGVGDWWVEGPDGIARGVRADVFPNQYVLMGGYRYRRCGTVTARQAVRQEAVTTLEGTALAMPGMWIVTDSQGNSWPVPDAEFRRDHEPA